MKVAVEDSLVEVEELLLDKGYEVVSLNEMNDASAIVLNGMDNNFMNAEDIKTKAPVIDASGYTAAQVLYRLENLMG